MQTNDELWQGALEDFAIDFIQKFYPDLYWRVDQNKPIEFLDKVLAQLHPESEDQRRVVDKLMKVHLKGTGDLHYLYIHAEAQGYPDTKFDRRNFIYFYRIFDRLIVDHDNLTVLVLYTSDDKGHQPSCFRYDFYGTHVLFTFPIFIIANQDPKLLEASENLFDAALLTAYWAIQRKKGALSEEDMLDLKLDLMRRLLSKNVNKEKIRRLLIFIKGYLRLEEPKNQLIFEQKYDELLNIQQNMGIFEIVVKQTREEGRQEGRQEARQEALTEAQEAIRKAQVEKDEAIRKERKKNVFNMRQKKFSAKSISEILDLPIADVKAFFKELDDEKKKNE
jgi:predicted transposase YdaD